ncbi:MAG: hypothetical protein JXA49_07525 [Actinobacteria bacterium]|nr:hypothetical protein [Actinomycetota bacterium]
MPRKKVFTSNRKDNVFLGQKRQSLSFGDESDNKPRNRVSAEIGGILPKEKKEKTHRFKGINLGRVSRLKPGSLSGIKIALIATCLGVAGFLVWFLFFVYPSPIQSLSPQRGNSTNSSPVKVEAKFSNDVKPDEVTLKVDGRKVDNLEVKGKTVTATVPLADGKHNAEVDLNGGGIMGKRNSRWEFNVDTSPPDLKIEKSKITDDDNGENVTVELSGKTEAGSQLKIGGQEFTVEPKGTFKTSILADKTESVEISATDKAGNVSKQYIVTQEAIDAKGIHISVYIASSDSGMDKMISLIDRTELNAVQIDLKDEYGQLAFTMDDPIAERANSNTKYVKLDACVDRLRHNDIYSIARVVVFKDPKVAANCPEFAVRDTSGNLWGDKKWVDPYCKEIWDYNIDIAIAAAKAGFNEIQFDYTRFPSDGATNSCVFPFQDDREKGQVIDQFLSYARERLGEYNVFISIDIFGLTASDQGDMGIGQNVAAIAQRVDYISPMVYPSHYNTGEYGIKSPESNPGDTVAASMKDFNKKIGGSMAKLRPWLQDFSLKITYSPDMVRRQIDAVENAGVNEWLLWDPDCTYSEDALKKSNSK